MTDVEAGGATVFPEIGLSLVPKKVIISVIFYLWVFRLLVSYLDTVCISAGQQQKTGEVFSQSYCWHSMIGYWHHTFVCVSVPCGKTTHPTANVSQQVNWKCPPPDKWVGSAPKEPLYWPYPLKSPYLRKLDFFSYLLYCALLITWPFCLCWCEMQKSFSDGRILLSTYDGLFYCDNSTSSLLLISRWLV